MNTKRTNKKIKKETEKQLKKIIITSGKKISNIPDHIAIIDGVMAKYNDFYNSIIDLFEEKILINKQNNNKKENTKLQIKCNLVLNILNEILGVTKEQQIDLNMKTIPEFNNMIEEMGKKIEKLEEENHKILIRKMNEYEENHDEYSKLLNEKNIEQKHWTDLFNEKKTKKNIDSIKEEIKKNEQEYFDLIKEKKEKTKDLEKAKDLEKVDPYSLIFYGSNIRIHPNIIDLTEAQESVDSIDKDIENNREEYSKLSELLLEKNRI